MRPTAPRPSMQIEPALRRLNLLATILGLLFLSCGPSVPATSPPTSEQRVSVTNVDGPTIAVLIGGRELVRVACGGQATLDPRGDAGPLPWQIDFVLEDGSAFGSVSESASHLLPYVLIRADGVIAGDTPGIGPVPATCP